METGKAISRRISVRGGWFLSLGAVFAAVVLAAASLPAPDSASYVRYVGSPLADGSRVTFLHPATVSKFKVLPSENQGRPLIVQDVQIIKPVNVGESLLYRLPLWERAHPTEDLGIGVLVTDVSKLRLPPGAASQGGRIEQERVQALSRYGLLYEDSVFVTNGRSGLQFEFQYQHLGASASGAFKAHKAKIMNSFQVLPPGAVPPVP